MPNHEDNKVIAAPAWLMKVLFGLALLIAPWMGWVTVKLETITVRLESQAETKQQVQHISARLAEHLSDPGIHHSGIQSLSTRLDSLERRVDRMETGR